MQSSKNHYYPIIIAAIIKNTISKFIFVYSFFFSTVNKAKEKKLLRYIVLKQTLSLGTYI